MQANKEMIENIISDKIKIGKKKFGKEFEILTLEIFGLYKLTFPEPKEKKLIPLSQWNDYHPDPSVKALRMYVFRSKENGFEDVIVRRGKRILIDEDKYFEWQNKKSN